MGPAHEEGMGVGVEAPADWATGQGGCRYRLVRVLVGSERLSCSMEQARHDGWVPATRLWLSSSRARSLLPTSGCERWPEGPVEALCRRSFRETPSCRSRRHLQTENSNVNMVRGLRLP